MLLMLLMLLHVVDVDDVVDAVDAHFVYIVFHGLAKCVPYLFWTLNPACRSYSNNALNA